MTLPTKTYSALRVMVFAVGVGVAAFCAPLTAYGQTIASIPLSIGRHEVKLPVGFKLVTLANGDPGIGLDLTLAPVVEVLETVGRNKLRGDVSYRGLELRPWDGNGLSVKVLLRLSCFSSNASIIGRFRPVIEQGAVMLKFEGIETSISNDICRAGATLANIQEKVAGEVGANLEAALSKPFSIEDLPEPYSTLNLSISDIRFSGSDASLKLIITLRQDG